VNKRRPDQRVDPTPPRTAPYGLCVLDTHGRMLGADPGFQSLVGVPLAELAGRHVADLVTDALDLASRAPHRVLVTRPDGATLPLEAMVAPLALASTGRLLVVRLRTASQGTTPVTASAPATPVPAGLLDAIEDQLYSFELHGSRITTTFAGPGAERLLGGPLAAPSDLVLCWQRAVHHDDRDVFDRHLRRLRNGEATEDTVRLVGTDGETRWVSLRAWPRIDQSRIIVSGIASDVTAKHAFERVLKATIGATRREVDVLEQARADAEQRARTDALTGAYNRRHLSETLAAAAAAVRDDDADAPALVLVDVDHFKRINDTYGHAAGDSVLVAVARRIVGSVRGSDVVARFGGEEFCVLLGGVTSDDALREIAEGVRLRIEADPVDVEGVPIAVTVSVGGARGGGPLTEPDDLIDAADRALYTAKRRGRNQTRLYSEWRFEDFIAEDPEAIRIAEALAMTASLREGASPQHAMQVADLALRTAEALGQPAPVLLRCRLGGWLHDVGKVAIPDRILQKPAPLDADEWEVMRSHPVIGEQVIRRVSGLKEACRAVRHHHERWDGSGYPDALGGDQIPIEARIVAAADVYSSMTMDRPFRSAVDHTGALAELERCAGTQLDPMVVGALVRVLTADRLRLDARLSRGAPQAGRRRADQHDLGRDEAA
jgi:diguanylate cyclase (GGDEF)-like protein